MFPNKKMLTLTEKTAKTCSLHSANVFSFNTDLFPPFSDMNQGALAFLFHSLSKCRTRLFTPFPSLLLKFQNSKCHRQRPCSQLFTGKTFLIECEKKRTRISVLTMIASLISKGTATKVAIFPPRRAPPFDGKRRRRGEIFPSG